MKSALIAILLSISCAAQTVSQSATVPVTLDHNRIIIDVYLPLADGTQKRIRGWLDNGNAELWLDERVAKLMALQPAPNSKETETLGAKVRTVEAPHEVVIGGMRITLSPAKEAKAIAAESIAPGCSAEINLPSTILRNYDVIMDYVDRELTIATPGQAKFAGQSAQAFVNPPNGLIQLPARIGTKDYQLTLDLGSCFSMLASDTQKKLADGNPEWPHHRGAVGPEIFWGMPSEATERVILVPSLDYGPVKLDSVGFDELPQDFMDFYRTRAGTDSSGLIGGSALLGYRVGIDYARSTVWFDQRSGYVAPGIDVVGLTLRPEWDGRYTVVGVPDYLGKPAVPDVKAGDVLVSIDKVPAKESTMGQIWSLLGGDPGESRVLVLEHDGKQSTVNAPVERFLTVKAVSKLGKRVP